MRPLPSRLAAVLQALLATFLWSTSFVLVKGGLREIPPLTFAGLRYGIAAVCLAPFALRREVGKALRDQQGANVIVMGCAGMARYRKPLWYVSKKVPEQNGSGT